MSRADTTSRYTSEHHAPSHSGDSHVNMSETERMVSIVGGSALALYGLSRLSPTSLVLLAGGLYAVYRGSSGHCHVYESAGIDHADR